LCGCTVVLCLIECVTAWSQNQGDTSQTMDVNRVAGDVYMLDNGTSGFNGGNIAVLVGNNGLVLVDAQSGANKDATVEILRTLSDKPVRYVIDTHCHADHTGGNATFQREGATIVAHANVLERLEQKTCDEIDLGLPTITFDAKLTLHIDGEEVTAIALPTGHTDGDAIVYFKKANVVHTGDAFVSINVPFHSSYAGGNILGLADALREIAALVPDDAKIIPGHGPQASMSDIRHTISVLDEVENAVSQQVGSGKTLDELSAMNLLEPWKDSLGEESDFFLAEVYEALVSALPAR
jgi:glyoxylase-like metal-dependent hydrolase (beta-lactamase superfamily II)